MPDEIPVNKYLHMGLGEAIRRLLDVEIQYRNGSRGPVIVAERDLILSALNHFELQVGFDCDSDGTPDTVAIFQQSAETSCCRITSRPDQSQDSSRSSDDVVDAIQDVAQEVATEVVEVVEESTGLFASLFGSKKKKDKK